MNGGCVAAGDGFKAANGRAKVIPYCTRVFPHSAYCTPSYPESEVTGLRCARQFERDARAPCEGVRPASLRPYSGCVVFEFLDLICTRARATML